MLIRKKIQIRLMKAKNLYFSGALVGITFHVYAIKQTAKYQTKFTVLVLQCYKLEKNKVTNLI
jgi:hypothetical protein